MSSTEFSTELIPEPGLRWVVLATGAAMLGLGLVVIAAMSIPPVQRLFVACAWLLLAGRQLRSALRHNATVTRIRVYADGSAAIADPGGCWRPATLAPGSIVLERVAWLRLDVPGASHGGELLAGNSRKNNDWRRLQMIWRHLGSAA